MKKMPAWQASRAKNAQNLLSSGKAGVKPRDSSPAHVAPGRFGECCNFSTPLCLLSLFETLCHGLRQDIANARGYSVAFSNSSAAVFNYHRFALERVFIWAGLWRFPQGERHLLCRCFIYMRATYTMRLKVEKILQHHGHCFHLEKIFFVPTNIPR
jgi:hypothetical protein